MKESEGKMRVAIAMIGNKGLQDVVSHDLGHSKTFTIIEVENGRIKDVRMIENPARELVHRRGRIIAENLANEKVDVVISGNIGPGASTILEQFGVRIIIIEPGRIVEDVLREYNLK